LHPPDVLLTDLRLGAFNEAAARHSGAEQKPQPLTVVMSAFDDPTLRDEAERCGARFLLKPFSSQAVLSSIGSVI
jgi:DNA-binding NarL/FixJ family response regulator